MKKIVYAIVTGLLILVTACSSLDQYPLMDHLRIPI